MNKDRVVDRRISPWTVCLIVVISTLAVLLILWGLACAVFSGTGTGMVGPT